MNPWKRKRLLEIIKDSVRYYTIIDDSLTNGFTILITKNHHIYACETYVLFHKHPHINKLFTKFTKNFL